MRRMILIAAAALCAMAFSAAAASGASAAETTAYTCVAGELNEFGNEHCSAGYPGSGPGWHHVAIPTGETTQLTAKSIASSVFTSSIALATVELEGTEVECIGCHFTNNGSVGAMKASGESGRLKSTGVVVKRQETKCEVHPPATPGAPGVIESEPLKAETIATNEVKLQPLAGTVLAKFEIVAKTGQKCNIAGKYEVTGFTLGTANGSTASFNVTLASGDLNLSGEPASITSELTLSGGLTGAEHHPLALT